MHITTQLDLDVLAIETDRPGLASRRTHRTEGGPAERTAPRTLVVVLDRSGSMAGDRLTAAKRALTELVDRLDPADRFGLITFDNQVRVPDLAAPLADKTGAKEQISQIEPGGSTDLSAGYLRGLQEATRVAGGSGATVLLISDGHANAGVTDPDRLGSIAGKAVSQGVVTTTLGIGTGLRRATAQCDRRRWER